MSSENCVETSSNNEEHNKCMLIMRQTDYDKETALLELKKYNGDVVAIIRNYMKNDDIEKQNSIKKPSETLNQKIYGEIRELLDEASESYRKKKEQEEADKKRLEEIHKQVALLKEQTSIASLFNSAIKTPSYSMEIYVPQTKILRQKLLNSLKELENKNPLFLNITFNSNHINQCLEFLKILKNETRHTVSLKLEPEHYSLEEFENIITEISLLDITHILLSKEYRQNLSNSKSKRKKNKDTLSILDALKYIKSSFKNDQKCIVGVIGYPEGFHDNICIIDDRNLTPEESSRAGYNTNSKIQVCPDKEFNDDLNSLKMLQNNGADYIQSQIFYDVSVFLQFCIIARKNNISIPIIPSIMPIKSSHAFTSITSICKTRIPIGIQKAVETHKKNDTMCAYYGQRLAISTCKALLLRGIQHIHYYSTNDISSCVDIIQPLQLINTQ